MKHEKQQTIQKKQNQEQNHNNMGSNRNTHPFGILDLNTGLYYIAGNIIK